MKITKGKIIVSSVIFLIFLAIIFGFFYVKKQDQIMYRDMERLSDMRQIQAALDTLYHDEYSYASASVDGCNTEGVPVDQCNIDAYLPGIVYMKDPGEFQYTVATVPDKEKYGIHFTLENDAGSLKKGEHTLTQNGIQ